MKNLIEALTIFSKYTNSNYPTSCEHDILYVQVDPAEVTYDDKTKLNDLGFHADIDNHNFYSYTFGSC